MMTQTRLPLTITTIRTHMRRVAIIASSLLLVAYLLPGVALACEGAGEEEWVGNGEEAICPKFKAAKEKCTITKVNLSPFTLEWETNEFVGTKGSERYAFKTEGCETKPNHLKMWKPGDTCKDVIEDPKFEAGTENKRCFTLKDEANGKTQTDCPDSLIME